MISTAVDRNAETLDFRRRLTLASIPSGSGQAAYRGAIKAIDYIRDEAIGVFLNKRDQTGIRRLATLCKFTPAVQFKQLGDGRRWCRAWRRHIGPDLAMRTDAAAWLAELYKRCGERQRGDRVLALHQTRLQAAGPKGRRALAGLEQFRLTY